MGKVCLQIPKYHSYSITLHSSTTLHSITLGTFSTSPIYVGWNTRWATLGEKNMAVRISFWSFVLAADGVPTMKLYQV